MSESVKISATARGSVFIAVSVDGFIARVDGAIDWLDAANAAVTPGEDCGYGAFMGSMDALVMGRNTFEKVLTFDAWPYGDKPVVVLSSQALTLPPGLPSSVRASSQAPKALCDTLGGEGLTRLYVDGGVTVQRFLADGLIDTLTITTIPTLLGQGKPLFGALPHDVRLVHQRTVTYSFGFVQSTYQVA
jgi:dihydrofolate reductase